MKSSDYLLCKELLQKKDAQSILWLQVSFCIIAVTFASALTFFIKWVKATKFKQTN